jgi:predicted flap endonuclease-1-like 5' DNA nuclease
MNATTIVIIAAVVVVALALLFLVRGRKQRVTFGDTPPLTRTAAPTPKTEPAVAPEPAPMAPSTPAVAPIEQQPEAIEAAPSPQPVASAPDTLTQIKGLGPKASAILNRLGITRFDQVAAWSDADIARIDAEMGAFKGRIARDRWVDQARLLATGDKAAFEAEFGALGS